MLSVGRARGYMIGRRELALEITAVFNFVLCADSLVEL